MFWKTGLPPGLSRLRGQRGAAVPGRRARTPSRPRPSMGWTVDLAWATVRVAVGKHSRRELPARQRLAADGLCSGSRERLLESFAAALTGDQDAAVSERPRDRAADPRMANERAVSVPHGALKRERQLITTTPSLDVDKLIAVQATERDRAGPSPVAGATRERDDRDRRVATLELLPHSRASRELAPPRPEPYRMRPGSLTTRRRVARVARQRLTRRAQALSRAPRNVHPLRRTRALPRRIPSKPGVARPCRF